MADDGPPNDLDRLVGRLRSTATDVAAVTVGLGILGVNRLQALRRSIEVPWATRSGDADRPEHGS